MSFIDKFRLPYRDDTTFGLLAFVIFIVPLAFSQFVYENFESVKFSLFLLCVGASLALFFFRQRQKATVLRYEKTFYWLLSGFFVWAAISAFLAQDKLYSFFGFYYRYTSGLLFYAVLLVFIWLLANLLDKGKLEYLLKILVIDAAVVAIITFLQSFGWIFYAGLDFGGVFRGPSLLGNINYSAMFMASVLPLAVYFFSRASSFWTRVYYSLTIVALIMAVFVLASRGAFLAMTASAVVALIFLGRAIFKKRFFIFLLIAGVLITLTGFIVLRVSRPQAISSITSQVDANTTDRLAAWRVSLIGLRQHPWFGSGPGNYALFFEQSRPADIGNQVGIFDDAHNLFLQLAVTGGLPLAMLFFGILVWATIRAWKSYKEGGNTLSLALCASLAAWVASSCFNPVPIPMYLLLAVLLVGMLLPDFSYTEVRFSKILRFSAVLFGCLIFAAGLASLTAEHLLGFGSRAYANGQYTLAYRLTGLAYKIDPTNPLFLVYHAGSAINLRLDPSVFIQDVVKIKSMHKTQAESYATAANLYNLRYFVEQDRQDLISSIQNQELALRLDPWFAARYGQLALDYYKLGNIPLAEQAVLRALNLNQDDFSSWLLLTQLYQKEGNRTGMLDALNQAFKLQPNIPQLKYLIYVTKHSTDVQTVPLQIMERQQEL